MRELQHALGGTAQHLPHLVVLLVAILNVACGGGGGGGAGAGGSTTNSKADPVETPAMSLSGAGVKGPLALATVRLFSLDITAPEFYDSTSPLATVKTDSNGKFHDLKLPSRISFPLVLVVDGKGAVDLNTGYEPSITALVNVITRETANSNKGVYATPLTTLAFKMARRLPASRQSSDSFLQALENAADLVQDSLGFGMNPQIDILRDPPLLNEFSVTKNDRQFVLEHRAALETVAAIVDLVAHRDASSPETSEVTLERFAADLSYEGSLNDRDESGSLGYKKTLETITNPEALTIPNTNITIAEIEHVVTSETKLTGEHYPDDAESLQVTLSDITYNPLTGFSDVDEDKAETVPTTTTTSTTSTTRASTTSTTSQSSTTSTRSSTSSTVMSTTTTTARSTTTTSRSTTTTTAQSTTTTSRSTTTTTRATTTTSRSTTTTSTTTSRSTTTTTSTTTSRSTTTTTTTTTSRSSTTTTTTIASTTTTTARGSPLDRVDLADDPISWSKQIAEATGTTYFVSTAADFNARSAAARPGDVIIIRNGRYSDWNITIRSRGTASAPVIYTAETRKGVKITGATKVTIIGAHNIIGGFVFDTMTTSNAIIFERASDNRFTDNDFLACGGADKARIITLKDRSDRNRLDHNTMTASKSLGMVILLPTDDDKSFGYSHDNRFDHNLFKNTVAETIHTRTTVQIGQFATQHTVDETRTLVDHNEFRDLGVTAITGKGSTEYYINNRFVNLATTTALGLRAGDNKVVRGNYFENVRAGMTIFGENHLISNNLFIDISNNAIQMPAWGRFEGNFDAVTASEPTGNSTIANNTFVEAESSGIEIGRPWGIDETRATNPPFGVKIMNNIVVSSTGVLMDIMSATDIYIDRNLYHATGSARIGQQGVDAIVGNPQLDSFRKPSATSPAIDRAIPLNWITRDFYERSRGSLPHIGAVER